MTKKREKNQVKSNDEMYNEAAFKANIGMFLMITNAWMKYEFKRYVAAMNIANVTAQPTFMATTP